MTSKICKFCQSSFRPSRSDMKFCTSSCRHKYKHRVKTYEQDVEKNKHEINELQLKLQSAKSELKVYIENKALKEKEDEKKREKFKRFKNTFQKLLKLSNQQIFEVIVKSEIDKCNDPYEKEELAEGARFTSQNEIESIVSDYLDEKRRIIRKFEHQYSDLKSLDIFLEDPEEEILKKQIESIQEQIESLNQKEFKLELPEPVILTKSKIKETRKERQARLVELRNKSKPKELGGADIQKMSFKTYQLKGELGRFLGELDNNMVAFALTGDSGAGKSYFSFALAKLFLKSDMTVKYFSLEEGIGKLTQQKLAHYSIGNELKITARGTLENVDKDAESFDVIIVDSYSKLTSDPKEFDWLRHNHPKTLFIIIFQKTTGKTIKGGAGIMYDSSATIDVQKIKGERVAKMLKGRYGTQGWVYSIDQGKIISEN